MPIINTRYIFAGPFILRCIARTKTEMELEHQRYYITTHTLQCIRMQPFSN